MKTHLAAAALALSAGAAHSATLTFDAVEPTDGASWTEQGFFGNVEYYFGGGHGEINGPIGAKASAATIARNDLFSISTIDITGIGGFNVDGSGDDLPSRVAYDNLVFSGYRGADLVASASMFTGAVWNSFTYTFDATFAAIDRLVIWTPYDVTGPNGEYCFDCSTIQFDNLEYRLVDAPAPVPLPASALLLLTGLAGAGLLRRRR